MKVVNVKVDDYTKAKMGKLREVNWSEVIRRALRGTEQAMGGVKNMREFEEVVGA
uniref:VapB-type antitoxin n=1 Tax=Caldiarchaeum subterraneum TaxID=311458 RepID=E6NA33_CALS0|nr:conserved hypothetical protein [Candidatus Caldarchaeum subterraneum]